MDFGLLSFMEKLLFGFAVMGTTLFIIRLVIQFTVGGGDITGSEVDGDVTAMDHDGDLDDHPDSDISFKLLSLQGLTAFFMMFGWTGLAFARNQVAPEWVCVLIGLGVGLLSVWAMDRVFRFVGSLQSQGDLKNEKAVGEIGEVYLTIPQNGTGQIQVNIDGRRRVVDAICDLPISLPTGARVKVKEVQNGVMVVRGLDENASDRAL